MLADVSHLLFHPRALSNGSCFSEREVDPAQRGAPGRTADVGGLCITPMLFWLRPRDGLPSLDVTARGWSLSKAEGRKGSYHCAFQPSLVQSSPSLKDELVEKHLGPRRRNRITSQSARVDRMSLS